MAIERIEPKNSHPLVWGDHTHRYIWASKFCSGIVLDAACGTGYGSSIILSTPKVTKYIGIDISIEAICQAREYLGHRKVNFSQADCQTLPFKSNSIDTVISFETLEHLDCPEKVIAEFSRVINENGLFIGSVPSIEQEQVIEQLYGENPYHKVMFSNEVLISMLTRHFKQIKIFNQSLEIFDFIRNEIKKKHSIDLDTPIPNPLPISYAPGPIIFIASKNEIPLSKTFQHDHLLHTMNLYQQDREHIDYVKYIQSDYQAKYDSLQKNASVEKETFNRRINELLNENQSLNNRINEMGETIKQLEITKNNINQELTASLSQVHDLSIQIQEIHASRSYRFVEGIRKSPLNSFARAVIKILIPKADN